MRAIVTVTPGAKAAAEALSSLGFVQFEGARFEIHSSAPDGPHAGPLWLGPVADESILASPSTSVEAGHEAMRLWTHLHDDVELGPFYYENHQLAKTLHRNSIPVSSFLDTLRSAGFRAARTHFTANAVRTDAPWTEVSRLYAQP